MMNKTGIDWCDVTWNPITGCTPVSEGCENCYAKRLAEGRLRGRYGYPKDEPFKPGTLHLKWVEKPLRWANSQKIFVCSMGDLCHEDVLEYHFKHVYETIENCPQHTFMLLTKRPKRGGWLLSRRRPGRAPLPNLWLGVSAENQQRADERLHHLLQIPAAVRFVSLEPLLGPVDIQPYLWLTGPSTAGPWKDASGRRRGGGGIGGQMFTSIQSNDISWIIVGAETGPKARPYKREWVEDLIDQCRSAGVPLFLKNNLRWPEEIKEFPKEKV